MNVTPASRTLAGTAAGKGAAIVTPSYGPDFERCRLLCETIDRHVTGFTRHYLLVEHADVALFRALETPRRVVVDERDILPSWLHSMRDPLSGFRRRIWLSLRTKPLRGWHVQQLRRIAIAAHIDEPALFYCDSDVVMLRDFDCASLWREGDLRLFRRDGAITGGADQGQRQWSQNAGQLLGLPAGGPSAHDYVGTLIAWRNDAVRAMCTHVEATHGRHWVEAIGATRHFSECMIYGRYADEVAGGEGHFHASDELCKVYWFGPAPDDAAFHEFVAALAPEQVAIGLQSFIGMDIARIRRLLAGLG